MNMFVLDDDPVEAAKMHCDKHVVKMILESAQILCTSHYLVADVLPNPTPPYKKTHTKHPCCKWVAESFANYNWLCQLGKALCREYTYRYRKTHKSEKVIDWCAQNYPHGIPQSAMTPFPQAMPKQYRQANPVMAYRQYYLCAKLEFAKWTKRSKPTWVVDRDRKK